MKSESCPRPLREILLRILVLQIILPSLALIILTIVFVFPLLNRNLEQRQLWVARSMAQIATDYIEHANQMLELATHIADHSAPEDLMTYLESLQATRHHFDSLYRLDAEGVVTLVVPEAPTYQGLDLSRQPYFQQLLEQQQPLMSSPFISLRTGQPTVYLAWPLADGGALVGALNLNTLQEAVASNLITTDSNHTIMIADQNGTLLAHPQWELVAQRTLINNLPIFRSGAFDPTSEIYTTTGGPMLGSALSIPDCGWIIIVQERLMDVYGPYLKIVLPIFVLVIIVWFTWLLSLQDQINRHVTLPLTRLSLHADVLAEGRYDSPLGADGHEISTEAVYEIANLADSFERMRQAIQTRQAALQASEEKYRTILENIEDGYFEVDLQGNFTFYNDATCEILGYAPDELMGVNNREYMDEATARHIYRIFNTVYRTGNPSPPVTWELIRRDGTRCFVETMVSLIRDTDGEPIGFRGIGRDTTERKRAEVEIQRRTAQLEALHAVSLAITAQLELDELLQEIVRRGCRLLDIKAGCIYVADEKSKDIHVATDYGYSRSYVGSHMPIGKGTAGRVFQRGEMIIVENYSEWSGRSPMWENEGIVTSVGIPLKDNTQVIGVLCFDAINHPRPFDEQDSQLAELFANQAAIAIRNARLFSEIRQRVAELEALQAISLQVTSTLELATVLETITTNTLSLTGASDCYIFLYNEESESFTFGTAKWAEGHTDPTVHTPRQDGLTANVARRAQPIIISDARHHPFFTTPETQQWEIEAIAGFPLKEADRVVGVFTIAYLYPHTFSDEEVRLLELLSSQAAIAITNAQLYRQVRDYAEQLESRVQERTAQLQEQYARLDAILNSATDGIVVTDEYGEIVQANPVARMWLTQTLSPADAQQLRDAIRQAHQMTQKSDRMPQKTTFLELTGLALEIKAARISGDAAAAVVVIHDITHFKAVERVKNRFVANVSHELRTPVTTVKLYAALLQRVPPHDDRWNEYLQALAKEADRQAHLVEDILQISRIDAGRMEIHLIPTPLNELVRVTLDNQRALANNHHIRLEAQPVEPGPVALVDPDRIVQVLTNLVENAIRYTPAGGYVVVKTGVAQAEGRRWATISVYDTGFGISEEELPHIFERFFRGTGPRTLQISGTGLGLAIVKEIVELHGGWVAVESRVKSGSTFTVWLPLTREQTRG